MHATRRSLLQLPLLAVLAGCTTSPVVQGSPGPPAEPARPTRTAEAAAAAAWVTNFSSLIAAVADSADAWKADPQYAAWLAALTLQSTAHLSRLVAENPVVGGVTAFPTPEATEAAAPAPATPADALALLTKQAADGSTVLQAAVIAAESGPERLLYASIDTAVSASLRPDLPPLEGGAEPAPFTEPQLQPSIGLALGHVWALVRALEIGLGRLPRGDALRDAGTQRLDGARTLRNVLLAALTADPPETGNWDLPNPMSTPAEIRLAWAVLETSVLDALGVLVAADTTGEASWLPVMRAQVVWVQRWGGRLPHWPGWVETA
ncbi:MAG: hypothetical protein ABIS84_06105 [Arachnia sp.]